MKYLKSILVYSVFYWVCSYSVGALAPSMESLPKWTVEDLSSLFNFTFDCHQDPSNTPARLVDLAVPFSDYMQESLYSSWGYYSKGTLDFDTSPGRLDRDFGYKVAHRLFAIWQAMVDAGDIGLDEPFVVWEFGAGYGDLAFKILKTIDEESRYSGTSSPWQQFNQAIRYRIGEISEALRSKQRKRLARYGRKAEVCAVDARLMPKMETSFKGVVLSNELLDAMPLTEMRWFKDDQEPELLYEVPILSSKVFAFIKNDSVKKWLEQRMEVIKELPALKSHQWSNDDVWLSWSEFLQLKTFFSEAGNQVWHKYLKVHPIYLPLSEVSKEKRAEVQKFLDAHQSSIARLRKKHPSFTRLIYSSGYEPYIKSAAHMLDRGFVISIDYGATFQEMFMAGNYLHGSNDIRTYANASSIERMFYVDFEKHVPELYSGFQDITGDVHFSHVAWLAEKYGLKPAFYGTQPDFFDFGSFRSRPGQENFKVLVHQTRHTQAKLSEAVTAQSQSLQTLYDQA